MSEEKKEEAPQQINTINVPLSEEYSNEIAEEHMKRLKELAPKESYDIDVDGKIITFKRRKIRTAERTKLEVIRQKLQDALTDNAKNYPTLENELYETMCGYYLIDSSTGKPMSKAQYDLTEFEEIKQILNACAFRTERPIPDGSLPLGKK